MNRHSPRTPGWEARVRDSFARQPAMELIGATLGALSPGAIEILLPCTPRVRQQHGLVHGGVVAMIADSAAGYSAFTMMPETATVLTVEYKMNFLAPAQGPLLSARGRVAKPGRTLVVVQVDVFNDRGDTSSLCATMLQTAMAIDGRPDAPRRPAVSPPPGPARGR